MTSTPFPLPAGFTFGYLTGRVIHVLGADSSADEDREPEARGASGQVILTPKVKTARANGALVMYETVTLNLDTDGYLLNAHNEKLPVAIVTGSYVVSFKLNGGSLSSFDVTITTDHTAENPQTLFDAAPTVVPSGPVTTLVVPSGAFNGAVLGYLNGGLAWVANGGGETGGSVTWDAITGKPTTFDPSAHTHTWSEIVDVPATFAPSAHIHAISEVTDLALTLDDLEDRTLALENEPDTTWGNISGKPLVVAEGATVDEARNMLGVGPKIAYPMTQAEYDALVLAGTVDPDTLYPIKEETTP